MSPRGERLPGGASCSLPLASRPAAAWVSRLASGRVTAQGPRGGQKFVPGHRPPGVGERGWRDGGLAAPRADEAAPIPAPDGSVRSGAGSRRAALPRGFGQGEPVDREAARGCELLRAAGAEKLADARGGSGGLGHRDPAARQPPDWTTRAPAPGALHPAEQEALCGFIAPPPSRLGPSEPRAIHGRWRSQRNESLDLRNL